MGRSLKRRAAVLHSLAGDGQGIGRVCPIGIGGRVMPPDSRANLVSGNLPGGADGLIVITRLDLRKGTPAVHCLKLKAQAKGQPNRDDGKLHFHPDKHCYAKGSTSRAPRWPESLLLPCPVNTAPDTLQPGSAAALSGACCTGLARIFHISHEPLTESSRRRQSAHLSRSENSADCRRRLLEGEVLRLRCGAKAGRAASVVDRDAGNLHAAQARQQPVAMYDKQTTIRRCGRHSP